LFEEVVEVRILLHLLLPLRTLELLVHLHQVLEIVKCKDSAAFVDHEEREEV